MVKAVKADKDVEDAVLMEAAIAERAGAKAHTVLEDLCIDFTKLLLAFLSNMSNWI